MPKIIQNINPKTVLIVILAFLLGWQAGHKDVLLKWSNYKPTISIKEKIPPKNINVDFKLFWDTWDLLSRVYLDKKSIDPQKLFYGAISGMVSALGDPYTFFLPPEQQKISQEDLNGQFEGVGIELGFNKEKRLTVVAPLDGTPAQKAGIKPQDLIIKINEKETTNMTLPEAVSLIRGSKGTKVILAILREGEDETRDFELVRDNIVVKSVDLFYKDTKSGKKVAVVKLLRFGERTNKEWDEVIGEVITKDPDGLILDLRNNPGGYLESAVFISSEFLEGGDVVLQENSEGVQTPYKVNRQGRLLTIPMKVLINKGSASASEIVAGALQDRGRAQLFGEKSFGKGTIQEALNLTEGAGIHISVAKWLTPNGRWVNDTGGFEPDVKIAFPTGIDSDKDPQIDKALEALN